MRLSLFVPAASLGFLLFWVQLVQKLAGQTFCAGTVRVTFWGALAMALTAGIGKLLGTIV